MLGNRRIRTAIAITGAAGLLLTLAAIGPSPVDAEVVTIDGEAYGVDGLITLPPEVQGDPNEEIIIEPTPVVVLPDNGSGEDPIREDLLYTDDIPDVLEIGIMTVVTQGSLSTANVDGGVFSDTLIDNLLVLDGVIFAEDLISSCAHDEARQLAGVEFNELEIDGTAIAASPAPNTEIPVPDVGTVRLNVQTETANRIEVAAMEVEFDVEDGPSVDLRLGVSECGTEVLDLVDDEPFVPIADLADPFDGDPEFTG